MTFLATHLLEDGITIGDGIVNIDVDIVHHAVCGGRCINLEPQSSALFPVA
jgi:hypothetical protein